MPLNVITLVQVETDNINCMITKTGCFYMGKQCFSFKQNYLTDDLKKVSVTQILLIIKRRR